MPVYDICSLDNCEKLLLCNSSKLSVYDSNFKLLEIIDKINNRQFQFTNVTTDGANAIYLADKRTHEIVMLDLQFKKVASFGTYGKGNGNLKLPQGLVYHNNRVYVCDSGNHRIVQLKADLKFEKAINLEFSPYQIKIINRTACIRNGHGNIFFYDLNNFKLKCNYETDGKISTIGCFFYQWNIINGFIYCYNTDGKLVDRINGKDVSVKFDDVKGMMVMENNDKILISGEASQLLITFK
jgi:hypothetical protein